MEGKLVIFSAPSGSGKTTIVRHLLNKGFNLEFSISACNRPPRGKEQHGVDYYFLSTDEFKARIAANDFIEWEEVYQGKYYGTLKSEMERIWSKGHHVLFDVDVVGGINLKKQFGDKAIAIFVMPPTIDALRERLNQRATDTKEEIERRLAKAEEEMNFAKKFDFILINDNLYTAKTEAENLLTRFLGN